MAIAIQAISSHPLLTRAVEEILADMKEYAVLPSASSEAEATSQTDFPRLFLLDACSLHTDLGPLAERCRSRLPGSKFLALVPPADSNYADEIRLFYWGIDGFVKLSETWRTELPQAIRSILNGQYWLPSEVLTAFVRRAQVLPGHSLTPHGICQARTGPTWPFADASRGASPSTPHAAHDKQGDFQSARHFGANRQVPRVTYPRQIKP